MASSISAKNSIAIASPKFANSAKDLKSRFSSNAFYHIYDDGASMVFATQTVNNIPVLVKVSAGGGQVTAEQ